MKRFLSAFIAMLLMLLLFCTTSFAASVYKVTIDVDFIGNLIFSTYDVDMYLNDLLLEQLPHGKDYEGTFYAEEGTNTIYFYKDGDKSIKGTLKIDLTGDAAVKCTIYCHSDEITVRDVSINIETPSIQNAVPEILDAPAAETIVTEEPKAETESAVRSLTESDNESATVESTEEKNDSEKPAVSFADVDLSSMTDQELADALAAIKTEQKKRVKTRIVLDRSEITLLVGKTDKLTATVEDLPEGESEPILEWHTSDKNLVTCSDGTIKALKEGSVIISCSGTLANGASIYSECSVQTVIPIASVAAEKASINMMTGETYTSTFKFKPENASVKKMTYERLTKGIIGATLKEILATKVVVFIGFSFGDEDFNQIMRYINDEMGEYSSYFYVVTLDDGLSGRIDNKNCTSIITDGTYFLHELHKALIDMGIMLDYTKTSSAVESLLDNIGMLHENTSRISITNYPCVIYTLMHQDGLIHAFERFHNGNKNGEYCNPDFMTSSIATYEDIVKKMEEKKKYTEKAYYKGYLDGLIFIRFYETNPEIIKKMPVFYLPGIKATIRTIKTYHRNLEKTLLDNSVYSKEAEGIIEHFLSQSKGDIRGIVIHHPPF